MPQHRHTDARLPNDAKGGTGRLTVLREFEEVAGPVEEVGGFLVLVAEEAPSGELLIGLLLKIVPATLVVAHFSLSPAAAVRGHGCVARVAFATDRWRCRGGRWCGAVQSANCCDRAPGAAFLLGCGLRAGSGTGQVRYAPELVGTWVPPGP